MRVIWYKLFAKSLCIKSTLCNRLHLVKLSLQNGVSHPKHEPGLAGKYLSTNLIFDFGKCFKALPRCSRILRSQCYLPNVTLQMLPFQCYFPMLVAAPNRLNIFQCTLFFNFLDIFKHRRFFQCFPNYFEGAVHSLEPNEHWNLCENSSEIQVKSEWNSLTGLSERFHSKSIAGQSHSL